MCEGQRTGLERDVLVQGIAKQVSETHFSWVESGAWTERMLAALGNGVKGNKWSRTVAKYELR